MSEKLERRTMEFDDYVAAGERLFGPLKKKWRFVCPRCGTVQRGEDFQAAGKEIDFVLEHGRKLLGIETKLAFLVSFRDASNLHFFLEEYPEAAGGLILYNGNEIRRLGEKILATPWTMIAGR